jgi:hypothetical protein
MRSDESESAVHGFAGGKIVARRNSEQEQVG